MARLNYPKISPQGFQKMSDVAMHVANSGLDMKLVHMLYLRVSQINGCPYCIDLHWHDATNLGVEAWKLNAVIFFRDAPWFDEKERAALDWAECVKLLKQIFELALVIERTDKIISAAQLRIVIGNPPGKKGSSGDAINWESLLNEVGKKSSFSIISEDSDYCSPLAEGEMNEFLLAEWKDTIGCAPQFYRRLSDFFKINYPDINLETEQEKDRLISELAASQSFAITHATIAALSKHTDFSFAQVRDLFDALILNNQINWIITDTDVQAFYQVLFRRYYPLVIDKSEKINAILNSHSLFDLDSTTNYNVQVFSGASG